MQPLVGSSSFVPEVFWENEVAIPLYRPMEIPFRIEVTMAASRTYEALSWLYTQVVGTISSLSAVEGILKILELSRLIYFDNGRSIEERYRRPMEKLVYIPRPDWRIFLGPVNIAVRRETVKNSGPSMDYQPVIEKIGKQLTLGMALQWTRLMISNNLRLANLVRLRLLGRQGDIRSTGHSLDWGLNIKGHFSTARLLGCSSLPR